MKNPSKKPATLKELHAEFTTLKHKLFGQSKFVEFHEPPTEEEKRYEQLFQFFYPLFRTPNFVSPR